MARISGGTGPAFSTLADHTRALDEEAGLAGGGAQSASSMVNSLGRVSYGAPAVYRLAERVGFEPTVEFPLHTLSKRAP